MNDDDMLTNSVFSKRTLRSNIFDVNEPSPKKLNNFGVIKRKNDHIEQVNVEEERKREHPVLSEEEEEEILPTIDKQPENVYEVNDICDDDDHKRRKSKRKSKSNKQEKKCIDVENNKECTYIESLFDVDNEDQISDDVIRLFREISRL